MNFALDIKVQNPYPLTFFSTREEVEVLKKLAEKSMSLTEEQYRDLVVQLEVEAHRNLD